ncbi:MAG: hypothetical protein ACI3YK_05110 [Eubacteriales bacterium]
MDNENENRDEGFSYTYSAREQNELKRLRQKYIPSEEEKMERLRRLDRSVYEKGIMASVSGGVIGALIMGAGMCCTLIWKGMWFIPGIIIALIGMAVLALAYPVYQKVLKKEREKIAPEILRLTNELLK